MQQKQYTDLFDGNRQLVEACCPAPLNALRSKARECLESFGLPLTRQEEYLHTDVSAWFEPDWGLNLGRLAMPYGYADAFRCNVPNLSTLLYYLAGDRFTASDSAGRVQLPEGVVIDSLAHAAQERPELVETYYGRLADMERPGIAALNTMLVQDGVLIYVPDGVVLDKPVQLVNLMQSKVDLMAVRRILVVLGRGAKLRLLLCDHTLDSQNYLTATVTEAYVGQEAQLEFYDLEETSTANKRVSETFILQEADSSVAAAGVCLHNGCTRNSTYVTLAGRGAQIRLDGIALTDKNQHADNLTFIDHRSPDCSSNELFKYVLDGESTGVFAGKVLVREGSQHTASEQTNRNICLTRQARMYTQPQLEIYADDVKCSHGATVGQLDEKALFYMRQRGIPEKTARVLLMQAFVGEVINRIGMEPLRDRLTTLVAKRLNGELGQCDGCKACR